MDISEFKRLTGPYFNRPGRWIVYGIRLDGAPRTLIVYPTEEEARRAVLGGNAEIGGAPIRSVGKTLDLYEAHLRRKGDLENSIRESMRRLAAFFREPTILLMHLDEKRCRGYHERILARKLAADTQINHLNTARSFTTWCVEQKLLRVNPLAAIKAVGRRRKGKEQLRIDEARRWTTIASEAAGKGDDGAIAAMIALVMGLRASEIVTRTVRDVDDGGKILWVDKQTKANFNVKTPAGKRTLWIPEVLRPHIDRLCLGKPPDAYLFPAGKKVGERYKAEHRDRNWVLHAVKRLCRVAGVREITAHGMRGTHSTMAVDSGATGSAVAAALGHESFATTAAHYATVESLDRARAAKTRQKLGLK